MRKGKRGRSAPPVTIISRKTFTVVEVENRKQFCDEHKLNQGNFNRMCNGQLGRCGEWMLYTPEEEEDPTC